MPTLLEAITGVPNACQALPNLVTGGQPTASHLQQLKSAGAEIILDIRDPMEPRSVDEPAAVRSLGMEYVSIPVVAGALSDDQLDQILTVLRGRAAKKVFFHCASGNRVGGALIPYFMVDQKMEEEDAVQMAMRIGMRSAELMEWGLDYARRHQED